MPRGDARVLPVTGCASSPGGWTLGSGAMTRTCRCATAAGFPLAWAFPPSPWQVPPHRVSWCLGRVDDAFCRAFYALSFPHMSGRDGYRACCTKEYLLDRRLNIGTRCPQRCVVRQGFGLIDNNHVTIASGPAMIVSGGCVLREECSSCQTAVGSPDQELVLG